MLAYIPPGSPPDAFPPNMDALHEPNGLLAVGGDLSVERLIAAYRRGIFPWYSDGDPLLWWTPSPRAVLYPQDLKISRSLRKRIRARPFELRADYAFDDVVAACAAPRAEASGTWIDAPMASAYGALHRHGVAHSVECWLDGHLVGGLYGVAIGRVFFGESMFSSVSDASKIALAELCAMGYKLIDCQLPSDHLASLGATLIRRDQFESELVRLVDAQEVVHECQ
jgi:leucyl/phenylalanyl-tRNA---protein transferase